LPTATHPNSTVHNRNLQTFHALKAKKQPKTSLSKNFAQSLLLLHNLSEIQLESTSIKPNTPAITLFTDIFFNGKYTTKLTTGQYVK
jgi:hypothetical protein